MAAKPILILGTGGNCVDILDAILDVNDAAGRAVYEVRGFLDDDPARWGQPLAGVPVLGPLAASADHPDAFFVNGIGSPASFWRKEAILARTGIERERFCTIVHPSAVVSRTARLGAGTVVLGNVTIASNVSIGDHVFILPNAVINHDDVLGDYTSVTSGVCISGGVTVGRLCYLGTHSTIIGNVSIGDRSLVGMGSVVLESVPAGTVVVGNPARRLRDVPVE